jgi:hypothetical protein
MDDELLTGPTTLVCVMLTGVPERGLDPLTINGDRGLIRVLLHDRKQVGEQLALKVA